MLGIKSISKRHVLHVVFLPLSCIRGSLRTSIYCWQGYARASAASIEWRDNEFIDVVENGFDEEV
jgi:hypothetical protein